MKKKNLKLAHINLIKRIENLIEYYQYCEDHHLEMFDRMVEQFPHLKGGLGDNITLRS